MSAPSGLVAPFVEAGAKMEKRKFYRLQFPYPERPRLIMGVRDYEVVDCSAHGVRYIVAPRTLLIPGDRIQGLLQFRRQKEKKIPVRGLIVRIQGDEMALYMPDSEIPFTTLWSEERYLRKHYPMRETPSAITAPFTLI
jgi:hypothetical protein